MNAHKLIATVIAAAILPLLPACTVTTAGHPDLNRVEWLADYDEKIAASDVERAAPTTTTTPQIPAEYLGVSREIAAAAVEVKGFWRRQGVDLSDVLVTMVDDESHAPCRSAYGTQVADGWTCGVGPEVVVYLPLLKARADLGGSEYVTFLVGHEMGHIVDSRLARVPADHAERLADCLSGAAAAGIGVPDGVTRAVSATYPTSIARHNAVEFGIDHGYQACIQRAK